MAHLYIGVDYSRSKMQKSLRKSPLKAKPLRNPGQSIQQEMDKVYEDQIDSIFALLAITGTMFLMSWLIWLVQIPPFTMAIISTLYFLGSLLYFFPKLRAARQTIKRLKQAQDGEQAVAEYLDTLKNDGCRVLHDVIGNDFNLDHVLIASQGVFILETKTLSKTNGKNNKIHFDGERITINSYEPPRNPVTQAQAQRTWLIQLLKESTGKEFPVKSVIVFPGWFVEPMATPKDKLWVIEPKQLKTLLSYDAKKLSEADISLVTFHLKRYIRAQAE
ncbi:MAG: nuclease-related domain-containing protein [Trueperaceae bacterium]